MRKYGLLLISLIILQVAGWAFDEVKINFVQPPNLPYFVGQPEFNIDADEFSTLIVNIKSSKSGTARLFWASSYDPQMNEPKSLWFFLDKSDNYKEYVFNVRSQNPYWLGFIPQLLILPDNGPVGIEFGPTQAIHANLLTDLRSGWREFWGPRGRLVIGSTINTIQSPNLFGQSIFVYIYWLIGLISCGLIVLGWRDWQKTGVKIFWVVVGFWALLEISSLYSQYFVQLSGDWQYVGKSPTEKLILSNTGDFYQFIQFCEKYLPLNALYDQRIPPMYNDIKARYYLYPRQISTTEAEYLVVYDLAVEPAVAQKYRPWQKFRDGALILKKR